MTLWITYAWEDDDEGDFSYLVQELANHGVEATYDKIALVPGQRLWEQIGEKIMESPLSGWAYLLTPASLRSEACREELAYALYRALSDKGEGFPLIGLLHAVSIDDVPPALKIRLCVSLANPDWKNEVAAGLEGRAPEREEKPIKKYVWKTHKAYQGNPAHLAIEVRPRFDQMTDWRFIVPQESRIVAYGWGAAGGGALSGVKMMAVEGTANFRDTPCAFVGCGNVLSPTISAYAIVEGVPEFVAFGTEPEYEVVKLSGDVGD